MLAKFVINVRKKGEVGLTVLGSQKIPWQGKSLPNLKKLYPGPGPDHQLRPGSDQVRGQWGRLSELAWVNVSSTIPA